MDRDFINGHAHCFATERGPSGDCDGALHCRSRIAVFQPAGQHYFSGLGDAGIGPTALAEILGAAIGLNLLVGLPVFLGVIIVVILIMVMIFSHSYRKIERWIIGFVSLIGLSFLYELHLCDISWKPVLAGIIVPDIPAGSIPIVLSVLGAVVMPHNLFFAFGDYPEPAMGRGERCHEKKHIRYEFYDTLFAMILGWAINSAMIIIAASVFYTHHTQVTEFSEAHQILQPLLGSGAAHLFGFALLCAGIASAVTAALSGGSIFAGMFHESFDIKDLHSRIGMTITVVAAALASIVF